MYTIQPSFTTGEISDEVNSRVDIEQYKSALLLAKNAVIRPFGSVCKRPGLQYIGECKYSDKAVRIEEFTSRDSISYLLEFGEKYVRIYKIGVLVAEIDTPFTVNDIPNLQFNQSGDTMFICSGTRPIQSLVRKDETVWEMSEYVLNPIPFNEINTDDSHTLQVAENKMVSNKSFFTEDMIGTEFKLAHLISDKTIVNSGESYTRGIMTGGGPNVPIVGVYGSSTALSDTADYEIEEGKLSWTIVTHGTWNGTVIIQISEDNGKTWIDYKKYTSKNDSNVTDSGTFINTYTTSRVTTKIDGGDCRFEYKIVSHTGYGIVRITKYISPTEVEVEPLLKVAKEEATHRWYMGSYSDIQGYPKMSCFFQDRLILANTSSYPNKVWMSRTGDYPNFGIEKASGELTDDSAITLSIINRKLFDIRHLVPATDLLILTNGNEWIVSGNSTVTPSNVSPRIQTQYGVSKVDPQYIGNRCVYVTARGNNVRDMVYDYTTDGYTGQDLSILSKDNFRGVDLIKSTYIQNPDSIVCYCGDDGMLRCMTYIAEQRVNGWSHYVTDGKFIDCESVLENENDTLYVVVEREINGKNKRYIEKMDALTTYIIGDNFFLDSFIHIKSPSNIDNVTVSHLIGKEVTIVVDGIVQPKQIVPSNGILQLEHPGEDILVGLAYEFRIKQPTFEMQLNDGSIQGRFMRINGAILRLVNSKGGQCGHDFEIMDDIEMLDDDGLFSGDYDVIFPQGHNGFNERCHVCIRHNEPYPFNIKAIIRNMSYGGGKHENINRGL